MRISRALLAVLAAWTTGASPDHRSPIEPGVPLAPLRLVEVAAPRQPVAMAVRPADTALYVAEKAGRVVAVRPGVREPDPVVDLRAQISSDGERGLLGIAFSPLGDRLYLNFTDLAGDTHVTEFEMEGDRVAVETRRDLLVIDQPYANHNGGMLAFGPDGHLYVATGDGGSGGDPLDNGQRLDTLLGKILRIDPTPSGGDPYTVPPDNPFVTVPGARPEIWSYGLRNPWRFSFDRLTGDLWTGDVGQASWEEVDMAPLFSRGGENYGWNRMEGSRPYRGGVEPTNHHPPVYEYAHDDLHCSVTGGYVYRGARIPWLHGAYVFADFCAGSLTALRVTAGVVVPEHLDVHAPLVSSFGEDHLGELYVLSLADALYRLEPALP